MDGVLANFAKAFTTVANEMYRDVPILENEDDVKHWDWDSWFPLDSHEISLVWKKITEETDNFWMGLDSIPGSIKPVRALIQDPSVTVYFITARPASAGKHIVQQCTSWLTARGISNPQVIVTKNKGPVANLLRLDYFLDDKVSNCNDVRSNRGHCRVSLMNRTHNKNMVVSRTITRVASTEEFVDNIYMQRYTMI